MNENPDRPERKKPRKAKLRPNPWDARPDFETEGSEGPPLLPGTRQEHDDAAHPYAVPGHGTQHCPYCQGSLPHDAVFCVHCGRHLVTGDAKPERLVRPSIRDWEEDFPLAPRARLFIALQFVNAFLLILSMFAVSPFRASAVDLVTNFLGHLVNVSLQAVILGSFDSLSVRRTVGGQVTIERTRRIAFLKLGPSKIPWQECHGVGVLGTTNSGSFTWLTFFYLLMLGCVPGFLFYWWAISPERFAVGLVDEYGGLRDEIYHTKHRFVAEEIARHIAEIARLDYRKVI